MLQLLDFSIFLHLFVIWHIAILRPCCSTTPLKSLVAWKYIAYITKYLIEVILVPVSQSLECYPYLSSVVRNCLKLKSHVTPDPKKTQKTETLSRPCIYFIILCLIYLYWAWRPYCDRNNCTANCVYSTVEYMTMICGS